MRVSEPLGNRQHAKPNPGRSHPQFVPPPIGQLPQHHLPPGPRILHHPFPQDRGSLPGGGRVPPTTLLRGPRQQESWTSPPSLILRTSCSSARARGDEATASRGEAAATDRGTVTSVRGTACLCKAASVLARDRRLSKRLRPPSGLSRAATTASTGRLVSTEAVARSLARASVPVGGGVARGWAGVVPPCRSSAPGSPWGRSGPRGRQVVAVELCEVVRGHQ